MEWTGIQFHHFYPPFPVNRSIFLQLFQKGRQKYGRAYNTGKPRSTPMNSFMWTKLNCLFSFVVPKATVVLRGKVDSRNEEAIRKALVKIIHQFTPIRGELSLELEKQVYKTPEGYDIDILNVN